MIHQKRHRCPALLLRLKEILLCLFDSVDCFLTLYILDYSRFLLLLVTVDYMESPERKELQAQWKTEVQVQSFHPEDISKHNTKSDLWIIIHGKGEMR